MRILILAATFALTACAFGDDDGVIYPYRVLRVIDGDTVEVEAPFLPLPLKPVFHLRVAGVDTPERGQRAKCVRERRRAEFAKAYVEKRFAQASTVVIKLQSWDKYGGRVVGAVYLDGVSLAEGLIAGEYAIEYDGGEKSFDWCAPS